MPWPSWLVGTHETVAVLGSWLIGSVGRNKRMGNACQEPSLGPKEHGDGEGTPVGTKAAARGPLSGGFTQGGRGTRMGPGLHRCGAVHWYFGCFALARCQI